MTADTSPPDDPYLLALASRGVWRRLRDRLSKFFFGDDIFISYARADAAEYAASLAASLTGRRFICYLDQFGSKPDAEMPDELKGQLMRSTSLVLVGTPGAAASPNVRKEIALFNRTGRAVIPVDVDKVLRGEVEKARHGEGGWKEISGWALIDEKGEGVRAGDPSPRVVNLVENSFRYRRRNQWQRFFLFAGSAFVALTVAAAVLVSGFLITSAQTEAELIQAEAGRQVQAAEQASDRAEENERAAKAAADASRVAEADAKNEAEGARLTRDLAVGQQKAAEQGMLRARELERQATDRAAAAARQEQGSRATLLAREPGREFDALSLAVKAAEPELESGRKPSEQVVNGLTSAVSAVDYALPLEDPQGLVLSTQISPDGAKVFGAVWDLKTFSGSLLVWDTHTGKSTPLRSGLGSDGVTLISASFSRDNKRLAVVSERKLSLWDLSDATAPRPLSTRCQSVSDYTSSAALDSEGRRVITLRFDTPTLCNIQTGVEEEVPTLPNVPKGRTGEPHFDARAVAFTNADEPALIGRLYGSADAGPYGKMIVHLPRTGGRIEVEKDDEQFAGFGDDGSVVTVRPEARSIRDLIVAREGISEFHVQPPHGGLLTFAGYKGTISSATFFGGRARAVTINGEKLRVADGRVFQTFAALRAHGGPLEMFAFSRDGRLVVTTGKDQTARLWDASTGALLHTLVVPDYVPARLPPDTKPRPDERFAAFSHDGARLVTSNGAGDVQVWDTSTGARVCKAPSLRLHDEPVTIYSAEAVSFLGGSELTVTVFFNGLIYRDARTCEIVKEVQRDSDDLFLALSADGTQMMTFSLDYSDARAHEQRRIKLWKLNEVNLRGAGAAQMTPVVLGAVKKPPGERSAEGRMIGWLGGTSARLLISATGTPLRIWEPGRDMPLELEGSRGDTLSVAAFSEDGTRLAVAVKDELRVWDTRSRKLLLSLVRDSDDATATPILALSADGSRLIVDGKGSTARLYPTSRAGLLELAFKLLGTHAASSGIKR